MIKAFIFDFDGVLADSHSRINELFTGIINKHLNLDISVDEFAKYPGLRFEQRAMLYAKKKGYVFSKEDIERIIQIGRDEYFNSTLSYVQLYPGVLDIFDGMKKRGMKIALGTNGSKRTVEKMLKQFKIIDSFSSIVTYDDVSQGKPNPEMFIKNAQEMGLKPEECIVVEDAPEGIIAAHAAGMKVIAITSTSSKEELKDADMIVKTIKDINIEKICSLQ